MDRTIEKKLDGAIKSTRCPKIGLKNLKFNKYKIKNDFLNFTNSILYYLNFY